ncbi:MAG: hypothetical protein V3V16_10475, partial [Melioribacteraceae bacterium]
MNYGNNYARIYPGHFDMSGEEYARMVKTAYVEDKDDNSYYFDFVQNLLNYKIKNNEGNLKDYGTGVIYFYKILTILQLMLKT